MTASDDEFDPSTLEGTPLKCYNLQQAEVYGAEEQVKRDRIAASKKKPKRKKNPQKKVTKFFQQVRNEQGFLLKYCKYQPAVCKQVYVPEGYGRETKDEAFNKVFCTDCMLMPCIVREHDIDLAMKREMLVTSASSEIQKEIWETCTEKLVGYFNKRYMKKMGTPQCVFDYIEKITSGDEASSSEEESDICE